MVTAPKKFKPGLQFIASMIKTFFIVGLIVLALIGLHTIAVVAIKYDKQHNTK